MVEYIEKLSKDKNGGIGKEIALFLIDSRKDNNISIEENYSKILNDFSNCNFQNYYIDELSNIIMEKYKDESIDIIDNNYEDIVIDDISEKNLSILAISQKAYMMVDSWK